jgi:hypothetical protein
LEDTLKWVLNEDVKLGEECGARRAFEAAPI